MISMLYIFIIKIYCFLSLLAELLLDDLLIAENAPSSADNYSPLMALSNLSLTDPRGMLSTVIDPSADQLTSDVALSAPSRLLAF